MVDQSTPHDLRAKRKEMDAIYTLDSVPANQLQIGFIGQGGGLQTRFTGLAAQLSGAMRRISG